VEPRLQWDVNDALLNMIMPVLLLSSRPSSTGNKTVVPHWEKSFRYVIIIGEEEQLFLK
jgi:hypothetical protein